jgi:hypothetical protein
VAMLLNEGGLAAAYVHDQANGERQVGFLPQMINLLRAPVVAQDEIRELEIPGRSAAAVRNGASDSDQADIHADVGALRAEGGAGSEDRQHTDDRHKPERKREAIEKQRSLTVASRLQMLRHDRPFRAATVSEP